MSNSSSAGTGFALSAISAAVLAITAAPSLAKDRDDDDRDHRGISQSGEQKDMRRVGHSDLQGRPAYHPTFIKYPNGRVIAFIGTHGGSKANPLKGGAIELNGTMIVDVTDPSRPVEKFHIPGPAAGAQTQSNRVCLGSDLPGGVSGRVYLTRNVQGSSASGYEMWDVTDVSSPKPVAAVRNLRSTHKLWWECKTGIAYMPGSKAAPAPLWRTSQSMLVYDWKNPPPAGSSFPAPNDGYPKYIRTYGVVGAQPSPNGTGPIPNSLHGPISTFEHPQKAQPLSRAATADDVVGNRLYLAWGVGDDGILQIIDRKKLLPVSHGGTWNGANADTPTNEELEAAQTSIMYMSPDQGGHTSFPVFGIAPKSYENFTEFKTRDIVLLASESTSDKCEEAPHWSFIVDVTVENSKSTPPYPSSRLSQNKWTGPMVLSTMWLDPRAGEKYPRGNYCTRGARFGVHSSEENFNNPFYPRVTFLAYFTGGVRAYDIREPQGPKEIAFYVPESNANTDADGYMTNNLEVDNRGYIYAVDRNGAGFDILELSGKAKRLALGQDTGRGHDRDDDD
jgi:hypothetical protein